MAIRYTDAIRAGRAFVELFADNTRLASDLRKAQLMLRSFGRSIRSMGIRLVALGVAFKAPFALAIKTFSDFGSELYIMSKRIGVSSEDLSVLRFQAQLTGVDMSYLEVAFRRMANAMAQAKGGAKESIRHLAQLGLNVKDLANMTQMQRFQAMMKGFAGIADETQRVNLVTKLFGRGGTRINAMLKMQAEGYDRIKAVMKGYGVIVSDEQARQAMVFRSTLVTLRLVSKYYMFTLGATLVPLLRKVSFWLIDVMRRGIEWITRNQGLVVSVLKVAVGITAAGIAMIFLGWALHIVSMALGVVIFAVKTYTMVLAILKAALVFLFTPLGAITLLTVALGLHMKAASSTIATAGGNIEKTFRSMKEVAVTSFEGIRDALMAGDILLAADILWAGLRLAWEKGARALTKIWIRLVYDLEKILSVSFNEVKNIWIDLQQAIAEVTGLKYTKIVAPIQWRTAEEFEKVMKRKRGGRFDITMQYPEDQGPLWRQPGKDWRKGEMRFGWTEKVLSAEWKMLEGMRKRIIAGAPKEFAALREARQKEIDRLEKESAIKQFWLRVSLQYLKEEARLALERKRLVLPEKEPEKEPIPSLPVAEDIAKSLGAFEVPIVQGFKAVAIRRDKLLADIARSTGGAVGRLDAILEGITRIEGVKFE